MSITRVQKFAKDGGTAAPNGSACSVPWRRGRSYLRFFYDWSVFLFTRRDGWRKYFAKQRILH